MPLSNFTIIFQIAILLRLSILWCDLTGYLSFPLPQVLPLVLVRTLSKHTLLGIQIDTHQRQYHIVMIFPNNLMWFLMFCYNFLSNYFDSRRPVLLLILKILARLCFCFLLMWLVFPLLAFCLLMLLSSVSLIVS